MSKDGDDKLQAAMQQHIELFNNFVNNLFSNNVDIDNETIIKRHNSYQQSEAEFQKQKDVLQEEISKFDAKKKQAISSVEGKLLNQLQGLQQQKDSASKKGDTQESDRLQQEYNNLKNAKREKLTRAENEFDEVNKNLLQERNLKKQELAKLENNQKQNKIATLSPLESLASVLGYDLVHIPEKSTLKKIQSSMEHEPKWKQEKWQWQKKEKEQDLSPDITEPALAHIVSNYSKISSKSTLEQAMLLEFASNTPENIFLVVQRLNDTNANPKFKQDFCEYCVKYSENFLKMAQEFVNEGKHADVMMFMVDNLGLDYVQRALGKHSKDAHIDKKAFERKINEAQRNRILGFINDDHNAEYIINNITIINKQLEKFELSKEMKGVFAEKIQNIQNKRNNLENNVNKIKDLKKPVIDDKNNFRFRDNPEALVHELANGNRRQVDELLRFVNNIKSSDISDIATYTTYLIKLDEVREYVAAAKELAKECQIDISSAVLPLEKLLEAKAKELRDKKPQLDAEKEQADQRIVLKRKVEQFHEGKSVDSFSRDELIKLKEHLQKEDEDKVKNNQQNDIINYARNPLIVKIDRIISIKQEQLDKELRDLENMQKGLDDLINEIDGIQIDPTPTVISGRPSAPPPPKPEYQKVAPPLSAPPPRPLGIEKKVEVAETEKAMELRNTVTANSAPASPQTPVQQELFTGKQEDRGVPSAPPSPIPSPTQQHRASPVPSQRSVSPVGKESRNSPIQDHQRARQDTLQSIKRTNSDLNNQKPVSQRIATAQSPDGADADSIEKAAKEIEQQQKERGKQLEERKNNPDWKAELEKIRNKLRPVLEDDAKKETPQQQKNNLKTLKQTKGPIADEIAAAKAAAAQNKGGDGKGMGF